MKFSEYLTETSEKYMEQESNIPDILLEDLDTPEFPPSEEHKVVFKIPVDFDAIFDDHDVHHRKELSISKKPVGYFDMKITSKIEGYDAEFSTDYASGKMELVAYPRVDTYTDDKNITKFDKRFLEKIKQAGYPDYFGMISPNKKTSVVVDLKNGTFGLFCKDRAFDKVFSERFLDPEFEEE